MFEFWIIIVIHSKFFRENSLIIVANFRRKVLPNISNFIFGLVEPLAQD